MHLGDHRWFPRAVSEHDEYSRPAVCCWRSARRADMIMDPVSRSSGNHSGIIDYNGSSYAFGFNYTLNFALTDVHRERRSITLAKFYYNSDGTISTLPWWSKEGVPQVGTLNPFVRVEAETMAWESGPTTGVWTTDVRTAQDDKIGVYVTDITNGDSSRYAAWISAPIRYRASLQA